MPGYKQPTTGQEESTDLTAYVPVGEPHDNPVFGGVVLVLVLYHQAFTGEVVRLPLWKEKKKKKKLSVLVTWDHSYFRFC